MRLVIIFLLSLMVAMATGRNACAQQNKSPGARFALVIGNAKYPDSEAPLKDAINDARELADELRRDGFDVDVGENLSKEAMRSAMNRLYGKIKSGSVAVVFFSGYGIQSDRQSYMIPVDAQIWTDPDVRRDGFSVETMLNEMNTRGAKVKVAILNASRRNPFERRFHPVSGGLAPVIAPPNTMIMYSAAPGAVTSDSNSSPSLFVTELIKEMSKPGLIGEEVFTQTRFRVTRASRGEQTPWFSSSLAEEFYFKLNPSAPPSSQAGCHVNRWHVDILANEPASINQTTTAGAACTVKLRSGLDSAYASIESHPKNGTLSQVDSLTLRYQPNSGFKGSDQYSFKLCATNNKTGRSGCSHITYNVTAN